MKRFAAFLFVLIFVFALSACGTKGEETTTLPTDTVAIKTTVKSQTEVDKIIEGINEAVVFSSVLDKYGSYMVETGTFETGDMECFFRKNGKIAKIRQITVATDYLEETYYGYYDGTLFNFSVGNARPNAVFDIDTMGMPLYRSLTESVDENKKIFDPDAFSYFMLIEETDDSYFFSIREEITDKSKADFGVYQIDKETLLPVEEIYSNANYYSFEYGVDVEYFEKMIDDWQGELRKVTVVKEYVKDGECVTEKATVEIPVTWELELRYDYYEPPYIIYMDAAHTVEYSYPGDGVDYTVYVCQIYDGLID